MRKAFPGLEEKIRICSQALFLTQGYSKVSMKSVAREVGTSVGNLYNYFPSKTLLFLDASKQWWIEFQKSFHERTSAVSDPKEALKEGLFSLLELFTNSSGLMEDFIVTSIRELGVEESRKMQGQIRESGRRILTEKISELVTRTSSQERAELLEDGGKRVVSTLIGTVKLLGEFHPDETEANHRFLSSLVDSLLT